jgi:hypothetical protein
MRNLVAGFLFAVAMLVVLSVPASAQDSVQPPAVFDMDFEPDVIDTAQTDQIVTVTARILDDLGGGHYASVSLLNGKTERIIYFDVPNLVEGSTYKTTFKMARRTTAGQWNVGHVCVGNEIAAECLLPQRQCATGSRTRCIDPSNQTYFINGVAQDIEPPEVFGLQFQPNPLNVVQYGEVVTATLRAMDDLSGVSSVEVYLEQDAPAYNPLLIVFKNRISGTIQDGVFQKVYTFPPYGAIGEWKVQSIETFDFAGNSAVYYPQWYCDQYGGTDCIDPSNQMSLVLIKSDVVKPQSNLYLSAISN